MLSFLLLLAKCVKQIFGYSEGSVHRVDRNIDKKNQKEDHEKWNLKIE